ncbi:MAG: hypothetical protein R2707_18115 [Acidimicrobiales bacterium]
MAQSDDDLIWYAAYGSNCLAARFEAYLTGGRARGATRSEPGARDPRPPRDSEACWFPTGVRFLGDSAKWGGGGVAFLDHDGGVPAPGRRYLITKGQFDDVVAQENRRASAPIQVDSLTPGMVTALGGGAYGGVLRLESAHDIPVVTFTSSAPLTDRRTNPPSAAYVGTILRGLLEVHSSPVDEIVDALLAAPGVAEGWTASELAELARK